jgi:hypothetical protein
MSRISRYQESIDKFFKNKGCCDFSENNKNVLEKMYSEIDHIVSIILLTTLNSQCNKSNIKFHGYYIASGIDILWLIVKINDAKKYYMNIYGDNVIYNFCFEALILVYNCLSQNINSFQDFTNSKVIKIYQSCMSYINKNVNKCVRSNPVYVENCFIELIPPICKPDLICKFINVETHKEYLKLKMLKEDVIDKYINEKYGTLCAIALIMGWIMGTGDEKMIPLLEATGIYFGYIIKIAIDFKNIERDIQNSENNISNNIIINLGFIKSYIKFIENKTKFIENVLTLGIYNTTIKEIIDLMEKEIDGYLEQTTISLVSQ